MGCHHQVRSCQTLNMLQTPNEKGDTVIALSFVVPFSVISPCCCCLKQCFFSLNPLFVCAHKEWGAENDTNEEDVKKMPRNKRS